MSATFLGNIVEKDIHKSSLIAAICFASGMAGSGFFIRYGGNNPGSMLALLGIYLCYGLIMGIGLGIGYLSPVKTLMLWFKDNKGLATGLAVAGYGGGFSNVPTLLSDHYGMSNISAIHGITLSAWAFAGLTGNNLANLIVEKFGATNVAEGYQSVLYVTVALYIVSLVLSFVFVRPMKKESK